jgi:hypothetical protein
MATTQELDLAPPAELDRPLWKSFIFNFRDRFLPEHLPPLYLTSRPVNLGMLLGDFLSLPWYRTIFTNLGDVITPETLPPLQLESRPVDVGELIADSMARPWWRSLLRSLADMVAPEKLPPLDITWEPANAIIPSQALLLTSWSNVISGPKIFLPDAEKAATAGAASGATFVRTHPLPVLPDPATVAFVYDLERDMLKDLRRSRRRERFLIFIFATEIIVLLAGMFWHH